MDGVEKMAFDRLDCIVNRKYFMSWKMRNGFQKPVYLPSLCRLQSAECIFVYSEADTWAVGGPVCHGL